MFRPSYRNQVQKSTGSAHLHDLHMQMKRVLDLGVDVGADMLDWWFGEKTDGKMTARELVLITIHSSILSCCDSIGLLLGSRSAESAKPLLRSMLESSFHLEWILKHEGDDLAQSYLVMARRKELGLLEKLNPESESFKSMKGQLGENDDIFSNDLIGADWIAASQGLLEKQVAGDKSKMIIENLKKHKTKKAKDKWYALNNGPSSVEELATKLGRRGTYETLYRPLSSNTHGSDSDSFILPDKGGYWLKPIRRAENSSLVFAVASSIVNTSNLMMGVESGSRELVTYIEYVYFAHIRPAKSDLVDLDFNYYPE